MDTLETKEFCARILVADDEEDITTVLGDILAEQGYVVETASDGEQAWNLAQEEAFDVVITDLKMPRMSGLELLRQIKAASHSTVVIIMTGFATVETAIEALKIGAYDYILKPFKVGELLQVVERAAEKIRLENENLHLREQISLLKLTEAVSSASLSLDEVLHIVAEAALKEVSADGVELLFTRPRGVEYDRVGITHDGPLPQMIADANRLAAALGGQQHIQVRGRQLSEVLTPQADGQVRTLLSIPLRRGSQILGMLNAFSHKSRKAFLPREEKALMVLGDRAATSLEKAMLYEEQQNTFEEAIAGFALALDTRDQYTHGHSQSVTELCVRTAERMGLDEKLRATLARAGILHDIGKIGISSSILNKPARLTPEEYEIIKGHPGMGRRILEPLSFLREVVPIVYHHHERWDGDGYPERIAGADIPLGARIMLVADTYDAMTSDRAYREGLPHEVAVAELKRCSGTQFDPECVAAFLATFEPAAG